MWLHISLFRAACCRLHRADDPAVFAVKLACTALMTHPCHGHLLPAMARSASKHSKAASTGVVMRTVPRSKPLIVQGLALSASCWQANTCQCTKGGNCRDEWQTGRFVPCKYAKNLILNNYAGKPAMQNKRSVIAKAGVSCRFGAHATVAIHASCINFTCNVDGIK